MFKISFTISSASEQIDTALPIAALTGFLIFEGIGVLTVKISPKETIPAIFGNLLPNDKSHLYPLEIAVVETPIFLLNWELPSVNNIL